jgi:hypothetical protein
MDKNKVERYKREISKKHKVNFNFVEFIGAQDYGDLGTLYYFNINDPNHPDYKSTKVVKEMDITQKIGFMLQEALGTKYQRNGYGKFGKGVKDRLKLHQELMDKYMATGMSKEEASKKAYDEIVKKA